MVTPTKSDVMLKRQNRLMEILATLMLVMMMMMVMVMVMKKMMMMMMAVVVLGAGECEGQAESGETRRTNVTPSALHKTCCTI